MDYKKNPPKIASVIPGIKSNTINNGKKNIITSISIHEDGQYAYIASSNDNRIRMIDCLSGGKENMNKYGITLNKDGARIVQATHHNYSVLTSGTPSSNDKYPINYVSLHDNQILRSFHGHTDAITNISLCPIDDRFLTSSLDGTTRLWILENAGCLAKLNVPTAFSAPYGVFDSTGLVFGILSSSSINNSIQQHHVHLYDSRNYAVGAFSEMTIHTSTLSSYLQSHKPSAAKVLNELCNQPWIHMVFNTDGSQILMTTFQKNIHWLIDGFDGSIKQCLLYPNNIFKNYDDPIANYTLKTASFTQDDKHVISIHPNLYQIYIWDVSVGACIHILENGNDCLHHGLALNPKYSLMISANDDTMLWLW